MEELRYIVPNQVKDFVIIIEDDNIMGEIIYSFVRKSMMSHKEMPIYRIDYHLGRTIIEKYQIKELPAVLLYQNHKLVRYKSGFCASSKVFMEA